MADFLGNERAIEEYMSYWSFQYDGLTELYNRNALDIYAQEYFKNNPDDKATIVFIDIDYFKNFNDAHGHHIGDAVLKSAAREIEHYLGRNSLIGRNGGDEFLIVLKNRDNEAAEAEIKRLYESPHKVSCNGNDYKYSYSIGYVTYPDQGILYHDLARKANRAMYQVKLNGRDGIIRFEPDMMEQREIPFLSFQDVIDFLPGASIVFSADEKSNMIYASETFASFFGYTSLDSLWRHRGREFFGLMEVEYREKVWESVKRAKRFANAGNGKGDKMPFAFEFEITDEDGERIRLRSIADIRNSLMTGEIVTSFVFRI
ncbi:MAG: diguanylate cyclase [Lachnospiraceae bacterium]|nr:diguanylate cyclase [Lachnospiraceae bacterium]